MIDPCLRLYIGAHAVMVNNNDLLKSHGIGNGSMARVVKIYCNQSWLEELGG